MLDTAVPYSDIFSGAKKTSGWQRRHAVRMYEEIRHRSTGVEKIAQNTQIEKEIIEDIKQHMFFRIQKFASGVKARFAPDFDQVQAWDRLTQGTGTKTDIELLKHEYMELMQMRLYGYDYETAHEIANRYHNWWELVEKERE